ncbi:hypothetical protein G9464_13940 [Halostella sp. JP-L12]|uniref:hypothetical protein n=1 Tax=Halostella TaxID=1843185 RepID=UPI000EF77CC2|nr:MULTISPECIES: hypothetical protein [Halostella]NHN48687.1 hypothetical protein [Halostella sp. JP-L12]
MTDMKNVDHTHPYNDRSASTVFRRGPTVVADGGEAEAEPTPEEDAQPEDEMRDVSHDDPHGEGANRVFERGREHDDGTGDVAEE